jgi:hypothetical protein
MEAAAARKEWRAVPDAPLRTNGAEVVSPPPSARKNPTFFPSTPPPFSAARGHAASVLFVLVF